MVDITLKLDGSLAMLALAALLVLLARRQVSTGPDSPEQSQAAWPPELKTVHPSRQVA